MTRQILSLNGAWQYAVNGIPQPDVTVPFSTFCVGDSTCIRTFDAPQAGHVALCFEGITYEADVTLNGTKLGTMLAYSYYEYDVTALVRPEGNVLRVDLRDTGVPFGPSEGWENYGGIMREVYLRLTDATYVDDVFFHVTAGTRPTEQLACVTAEVTLKGGEGAVCAALTDHLGRAVTASGTTAGGTVALTFDVPYARLWSPEDPYLYTLTVTCGDDVWQEDVGIKDFRIGEHNDFELNGKRLFLRGINRHDMWGEQGHTLTDDQILQDLTMIKATGVNYVRLVHYPHDRRVVAMADRIGLLVSEEPGLWWSKMDDRRVTDGALEVMGRVVRRDRNRVSVAFWLAFNECIFTPDFIRGAGDTCRRYDPYRLVSGANCMELEMTRSLFTDFGFDFYTYHPYGPDTDAVSAGYGADHRFESLDSVMEALNDKPLVFTEWGGLYVYENPVLFTKFLTHMQRAWTEPERARLAGCAYWVWADMFEFGRGETACYDGILREGLVDIYRHPRGNLDVFARLMHGMDCPNGNGVDSAVMLVPQPAPNGCATVLDIFAAEDRGTEADLKALIDRSVAVEGYQHKRARRLAFGPVLPERITQLGQMPVDLSRPQVVHQGEVTIPVNGKARQLFIAGNVTLPWGYPLYGERGEVAGEYVLTYEDGTEDVIPLKNGENLTTVLGTQGPSRVEPYAPGVVRIARWRYDANWEHYIMNAMTLPCDSEKTLVSLTLRATHPACSLLLYGVTMVSD